MIPGIGCHSSQSAVTFPFSVISSRLCFIISLLWYRRPLLSCCLSTSLTHRDTDNKHLCRLGLQVLNTHPAWFLRQKKLDNNFLVSINQIANGFEPSFISIESPFHKSLSQHDGDLRLEFAGLTDIFTSLFPLQKISRLELELELSRTSWKPQMEY